jgi:hypothetical protein
VSTAAQSDSKSKSCFRQFFVFAVCACLALLASNARLNGMTDRRGKNSRGKAHTAECDSRKARSHSRSKGFLRGAHRQCPERLAGLETGPLHKGNNSYSTCSGLSLLSPLCPSSLLSRTNVGQRSCGDLAPFPPIDRDNCLSPRLRPPSPLRSHDPGATGGRQDSAGSTDTSPLKGRDGPV